MVLEIAGCLLYRRTAQLRRKAVATFICNGIITLPCRESNKMAIGSLSCTFSQFLRWQTLDTFLLADNIGIIFDRHRTADKIALNFIAVAAR